jgi:ABC-type Fe3+/spermidine/putrescine transport system ATPase subunit
MALIETIDLWKTYVMGSEEIHALRGVNISIERGEYVAIMGPSGSGKSTLMNLIGCLDTPSTGSYVLKGREISSMNDDELAQIRNKEIGFIFQTFNLLPRADAVQNLHAVVWELGLIGAFILLAAAVAGWAFSGTFARPMAELARAAQGAAFGRAIGGYFWGSNGTVARDRLLPGIDQRRLCICGPISVSACEPGARSAISRASSTSWLMPAVRPSC